VHVDIYILFFPPHSADQESDSASSTAEFVHQRALQPRQKDQNQSLLDKLTQEKLASKSKPGNKPTDLSSGTLRSKTNPDLFTSQTPSFITVS